MRQSPTARTHDPLVCGLDPAATCEACARRYGWAAVLAEAADNAERIQAARHDELYQRWIEHAARDLGVRARDLGAVVAHVVRAAARQAIIDLVPDIVAALEGRGQ